MIQDIYLQRILGMEPDITSVRLLYNASSSVYKVEKHGLDYILKTPFIANEELSEFVKKHLRVEKEVLERTNGVQGVTHLVQSYDFDEGEVALLKEYAPGRHTRYLSDELVEQLKGTVASLHRRGISGLDLKNTKNFIVSDDNKVLTLVDFGSCKIKEVDEEDDFYMGYENDLLVLRRLSY